MDYNLPENIPEGFEYYPDFLSAQEESDLLKIISGIELQTFVFQGYTAKRKVAAYGFNYSFDSKRLSKGLPVPEEFRSLIGKAALVAKIPPDAFEELLITEYPEGAVINWHRDAPPFDIIAGISLLSDCRFRLRPHDKTLQKKDAVISFTAKRLSLYILKGPARSDWEEQEIFHYTQDITEERLRDKETKRLRDERMSSQMFTYNISS